jgi:hypothetical protein
MGGGLAAAEAGTIADVGPDRKLLVLVSDCAMVRQTMVPALAARYAALLAADGSLEECSILSRECCEDIQKVCKQTDRQTDGQTDRQTDG